MQLRPIFVILLFVIWSFGSTYWYVCKIKLLCDELSTDVSAQKNIEEPIRESLPKTINDEITDDFVVSIPIAFNSGSNELILNGEQVVFMSRLTEYLVQNQSKTLELIGHTDDVGEEVKNLKLGEERAKAVKNHLVNKGVQEQRIKTDSKGELNPVADNKTEAGREKNRRVEFLIK